MSPTSYQTAPSRVIWCRGPESNRYELLGSQDFKSCASACSATPAFGSQGGTRTRNLPVNSRVLHHWATWEFGDFLFSRVVTDQVPSALGDLTSVFGMSTGVSLLPSSPYSSLPSLFSNNITGQAFNLLVSVSLRCYHPYTSDLSTSFSSRNLFGNLILRRASYLDAFSSYLFQT